MIKRVKQFFYAFLANKDCIDQKELVRWLDEEQILLFYQMKIFDQYHCQRVAKTAYKLAKEYENVDYKLLMQASYLHDVGRQKEDIILIDKIIPVLLSSVSVKLIEKLMSKEKGKNFWQKRRYALYLYKNHAEHSCKILAKKGYKGKLLKIIAKHHQKEEIIDDLELKILRLADELN